MSTIDNPEYPESEDEHKEARKELLIRMAKHKPEVKMSKQICECGHTIDAHVGNGQLEECISYSCECKHYKEVEEKLK